MKYALSYLRFHKNQSPEAFDTYHNIGLLVLVEIPRLRVGSIELSGTETGITGLQPLIGLSSSVTPAQLVVKADTRI